MFCLTSTEPLMLNILAVDSAKGHIFCENLVVASSSMFKLSMIPLRKLNNDHEHHVPLNLFAILKRGLVYRVSEMSTGLLIV